MSCLRNSARRIPNSEREPCPVFIFNSFHTKPHGDTSSVILGDRSPRRSRSHRDRSLRRSRSGRDSLGSGNRDFQSNPIRIKRSRTPMPPLKFDVQCFQQFTNSPCTRCDQSPLFSGDYKLRGNGGPYQNDSKRTVSPQLPLFYLLQNQHLHPLARNPCRFNTCTKTPGGGWHTEVRVSNFEFRLCSLASTPFSSRGFGIEFRFSR